jgi:nitroreductase
MDMITKLNWRYATKKFDPERLVPQSQIDILKEAIRLTPTSYGLQLGTVLIVEDKEIRAELVGASWGQEQTRDASHLFIFCSPTGPVDRQIDEYVRLKAQATNKEESAMNGYSSFVKGKLNELSDSDRMHWIAKQNYIALGNLLTACAELHIDACPMEGFEADQYDTILSLADKGLKADCAVTIGYRHADDAAQQVPKVRRSAEQIFSVI